MRGVAVALIVMTLGAALLAGAMASERSAHFDPALSQRDYPCSWNSSQKPEPLWPDFDSWFGGALRGANEPSLYRQAQADPSKETIRLTFLPSFTDTRVRPAKVVHSSLADSPTAIGETNAAPAHPRPKSDMSGEKASTIHGAAAGTNQIAARFAW
ncbi:hypothetical protein BrevBR_08300 [Brevundimonas sp. BR2-1]|uniref:hypothetical protein n=1 Tax=Brevundimonas sp. BR2-1 TaxID=3031123 RepID=UPI0030B6353D